jgi:peptidoglycan/LPS O-acetylase OafA/YrhL
MPGLDGLRALAVSAVIAYHVGVGWASGGLLGVGVFFTLSGYLITDLLLAQRDSGKLRLGNFWLARARRLLPGLFVMLIGVSVWVCLADRAQLPVVRDQVAAASVYVSNWWQSFQHISYFSRFGPPSPLNHLWSLAVEEQFYVIWPWLLLFGARFIPERRQAAPVRPRLALAALVLAIASAVEMALLFHPGFDSSRVYYGTDTRAFGLLFGAALAMVWPSRALSAHVGAHARGVLDAVGVCGLVVIALLVWRTNQYSAWLYHGGLVVLSVATVFVVAALAHPVTCLGRALGWGPLRWVGVRSYGLYLWHVPVIILTTPPWNRGVQPLRAVLQVAASVALAALSWRYVEEPIRRGALRRLWSQARSVRWRPRSLPSGVRVSLGATALALVLAGMALAGVRAPAPVRSWLSGINVQTEAFTENEPAVSAAALAPSAAVTAAGARGGAAESSARGVKAAPSASAPTTAGAGTLPIEPVLAADHGRAATAVTRRGHASSGSVSEHTGSPRTSCPSVVHIGDSTSEGMISSNYLPDPGQRLNAQYARVGVRQTRDEITGATSIVETLPGGTNAYDVARSLVGQGYRGCWVIALGTNDSADIYVGSSVSLAERIRKVMSVIGSQPVMWVNAKSLVARGPYSESDMQHWNGALLDACPHYRNMRVYDWASAVRDKWFIPDGIHYYSPGYAARAHLIAEALAKAFPAGSESSARSCVVSTPSISVPVLGVGR